MDKKPFDPGKISAISDGLKELGLKPIEHFGFGIRPETGEYLIYFNLPYNGSFHAILEIQPELPEEEKINLLPENLAEIANNLINAIIVGRTAKEARVIIKYIERITQVLDNPSSFVRVTDLPLE